MDNFNTDNQDEINMVGKLKVMDKWTSNLGVIKRLGITFFAQEVCTELNGFDRALSELREKVMSDAVDVEQERLALIDEVRELKEKLEQKSHSYYKYRITATDEINELKDKLALECAKAVSRNDFIATVTGVDWDKDTYEKARAWDNLEALYVICGEQCLAIEIKGNHHFHSLKILFKGIERFISKDFSKEAVSNALESIRGES